MELLIQPPNINSPSSLNIRAFFTTRIFANGNITDSVAEELDIPRDNIYMPVQKHTNKIHVLNSDREPAVADAVITDMKGILIGIQVADCVPILLYDKNKKIIGAVHAGWRGTAKQILKGTIAAMTENFHCSAKDISIAIGPSIRQCCYEVGDEVKEDVCKVTGEGNYYLRKNGRYFIDIAAANKIQALSMGIPEQNVWQSNECTFCNPERFHSYRYAKDHAGRQGGFIGMW
ncbi:MAG: peptidoglycan editing factor PgeF [Nitrospirae bacterium]|nr:peptidoglycan editing factor PgeF [Nitrospirota bacterium]